MVHARDFSEGVARTDPVVAMLARFFLNRGIFFFHDGRRKADVILGISVIRKIEEFGRIQRDFADAHFNFSTAFQGDGSSWGIGIRPGLAVDLNDHFSVVSHFMRIGYYGGGFIAGINSSLTSIFTLSPIVGVYYSF